MTHHRPATPRPAPRPTIDTAPTGAPGADARLVVTQHEYGGTEVLALERLPRPVPGKGEVLVRVHAAGVDRGTLHMLTGLPRLARLALGLRRPRRRTPGLDVAGTVVETGPGVSGLAVGQEVFGIARGSLAEIAVATERKLVPTPPGITPVEAAVLGVSGLTALQALDAARVGHGDRVLVLGASGGVGSLAVKLAVGRGAVVTGVCSAAKADAVRAWGASEVLDHAVDDVTSGSARFDAIIDIAGGTRLRPLRRILAPTGTIVFVGVETGGAWTGGFGRPMRTAVRMLLARQRYVMLTSRETHEDLQRIAEAVTDGLRPHVHATYPLAQTAQALDDLAAGRVTGKLAVAVDVDEDV